MEMINTSFQLSYEALKLGCAAWPEVKAEKRIMVNGIIELMQQDRDRVEDSVEEGLVGWRWC